MNARSLRFQLVAWYAGLLTGCFALIGAATYLVLQSSVVSALKDNQLRRARQIGQLLLEEIPHRREAGVGEQIEARYAPGFNDRFVQVTRSEGGVLYRSEPPKDHNFDPAQLPPAAWPVQGEGSRKAALGADREMLLAGYEVQTPAGSRYLVEAGAPMDDVQAHLRQWLVFLVVGLPVVAGVAIAGGLFS